MRVRVTGASLPRFLNACTQGGVRLRRMERVSWDRMDATLSLGDFRKLRSCMGRTGCRVHILKPARRTLRARAAAAADGAAGRAGGVLRHGVPCRHAGVGDSHRHFALARRGRGHEQARFARRGHRHAAAQHRHAVHPAADDGVGPGHYVFRAESAREQPDGDGARRGGRARGRG